jgi:hypothetical protein
MCFKVLNEVVALENATDKQQQLLDQHPSELVLDQTEEIRQHALGNATAE